MSLAATDRAPTAAERGTLTENERREALRARDKTADGLFVYAVRTTGVYCRPSCGARPARAENVVFLDTAARPSGGISPLQALPAGRAAAGPAERRPRRRACASSRTPKRRRPSALAEAVGVSAPPISTAIFKAASRRHAQGLCRRRARPPHVRQRSRHGSA